MQWYGISPYAGGLSRNKPNFNARCTLCPAAGCGIISKLNTDGPLPDGRRAGLPVEGRPDFGYERPGEERRKIP